MLYVEEELKKLGEPDPARPLPFRKLARVTAAGLDRAASQAAFKIFEDKKFRELVLFETLERTEQDRIFNELVLACIVLILLTLESPDLRVPEEMKEYFLMLKEELPNAHIEELRRFGIERKHLMLWEKLISMRYEEYANDRLKAREAAMAVESKEKEELTTTDLENIQMTLPVQTVAIGCHMHICRGKTKGRDELFKFLVKRLGRFYVEIRVPMEGGKITLWTRLAVKFKRLFG